MHLRRGLLLIMLLRAGGVAAQTTFTWSGGPSGGWESAGNWTPTGVPGSTTGDGAVISGGAIVTLSAKPDHALSTLSVKGGGVLSLEGAAWTLDVTQGSGLVEIGDASTNGTLVFNDDNSPNGGIALASKSLAISANGLIDADGTGGAGGPNSGGSGAGPGGGNCTSGNIACSGGGHGGQGGTSQNNFAPGNAYGSIVAPIAVGSGGGSNSNSIGRGGSGGGRIRIVVSGLITNNGFLSANGLPTDLSDYDGGGSGGSIWITAGSFAGGGGIEARGGAGYVAGGGGGGRIALDGYSGGIGYSISARGGNGYTSASAYNGAAGTIARTPAGGGTSVTLDNAGVITSVAVTPLIGFSAQDLTLTGEAVVQMSSDEELNLTGSLTVPANQVAHVGSYAGTGSLGGVLRVRAATIQILGNLLAGGAGYAGGVQNAGKGPGGGSGNCCSVGAAGGGSHGGLGGAKAAEASAGPLYGSVTAPLDMGSGGGGADISGGSWGGAGGGVVQLFATGSLTLSGQILADGQDATGPGSGGGAGGGSIFLAAPNLSGNGTLSAAGGAGNTSAVGHEGGGGSGGRIAVYSDTFSSLITVNVAGGGSTYAGAPGVVVRPTGDSLVALDSPALGAGGAGEFVWSGLALPGAGKFTLYVDDDVQLGVGEPGPVVEAGEAMQKVDAVQTNASVTNLTPGKTYFWQVVAFDSGSHVIAASPLRSFVGCSVSCNVPPQFLSSPNGFGQCGTPYAYAASGSPPDVAGSGPFVFAVGVAPGETAPAGLSVVASTGAFGWTPTQQDEGIHHFQLTASGPGGSATQSYDVVVTCPNQRLASVGCSCSSPGEAWPAAFALLLLAVARRVEGLA